MSNRLPPGPDNLPPGVSLSDIDPMDECSVCGRWFEPHGDETECPRCRMSEDDWRKER